MSDACRNLTVIVSGGGSAGHLYPAAALALEMKRRMPQLRMVLATDEGFRQWDKAGQAVFDETVVLRCARLDSLRRLASPGFWNTLWGGFGDAGELIRGEQPAAVVGFGGFASFPCVWEAQNRGVPTVIHEQNVGAGLANRWLARRARKRCITFGDPAERYAGDKTVLTGYPLVFSGPRIQRREARERLGVDLERRTLLVSGGSQGSMFLNQTVEEFFRTAPRDLMEEWQVLWVAGRARHGVSRETLESPPDNCRLWDYCDVMYLLYGACDVALTRSGAGTLHELAFYRRGACLVPYPGSRSHQEANARAAARFGGAMWVRQRDFGVDDLLEVMKSEMRSRGHYDRMGECLSGRLRTDGAAGLADVVEGIVALNVESGERAE
ncbi:MAG: UDP-N-acetylglucosamine--N-acetylmuramyl-(pentapeptide) pyrophosphoryl-undecaprenol N-acetylglucosamine transferase [Candidatus Omnitrophica bacterium]|nr:UDP-N-acetylglucosamine--N-acetylmuramyl-(pentapeptide) pyrophosphoryl-undecaprenol N-acetylglucosamine transferase [Candidatus Omnitrophota bacterium]